MGEVLVIRTLRAVRFLFVGPVVLVVLFFVNLMTSPGHWWAQWAALGIGIAWIISLFRVIQAVVIAGGIAALFAYFNSRKTQE
jgi:hypothetical protein